MSVVFNANPNTAVLMAVKRIFQYLKGTVNLALKHEQSDSGTVMVSKMLIGLEIRMTIADAKNLQV